MYLHIYYKMQKFKTLTLCIRNYSTKMHASHISSKNIRKNFIEFFAREHNHKFVRSSSVVPYCDRTVTFVNAGMNQFKSIFLGTINAPYKRVVNSQKCIRVGGKHNDLSVVGTDGYHHTFFEMLGNWSFNDYSKREACAMAWSLIKDVYKIDIRRLYVTYFKGDEKLNIPADIECREIWRSLGVSEDRIIPFGIKENFWEMGITGPCGPCTEIHIDHLPSNANRANRVNCDLPDLTELWNIVFIQYNRNPDGTVIKLPQQHVDTGMGLERLAAILQNKISNYDTDLFTPIFNEIQKVSKSPTYKGSFDITNSSYAIDTAYRILSDHGRMITVCLADGMFPDQNHKLRKIIRKSILVSERSFKKPNLLYNIIPIIIEILGDTYPEMAKNEKQIFQIIAHEEETFLGLRKNATNHIKLILEKHPKLEEEIDLIESPGFILGYNELLTAANNLHLKENFDYDQLSFKLYDTYGLDLEGIEKLYNIFNIQLNKNQFQNYLNQTRMKTKTLHSVDQREGKERLKFDKLKILNQLTNLKLQRTMDCLKYEYSFDEERKIYSVPKLQAQVIAIVDGEHNSLVDSLAKDNGVYYLITDRSNFYYESGGQQSDCGFIQFGSLQLAVDYVENIDGFILHRIKNENYELKINDTIELVVDNERRSSNTIHHTATHLLNASVRNILKCAVYQKSSSVTQSGLKLEVGVFGSKLDKNLINEIENLVRKTIQNSIPLRKKTIDAQELLVMDNVTTVPGEIYPETNLNLLEIIDEDTNFISRELCCGTHVFNTKEINDFCITNVKLNGRGSYIINAVAGKLAEQANIYGHKILEDVQQIQNDFSNKTKRGETLESKIVDLKKVLTHGSDDDNSIIPQRIKSKCLELLSTISKEIKEKSRENLKELLEIEMNSVLEQKINDSFVVHFLVSSSLMESVSLQRATKCCSNRPILVISLADSIVKARCCVPKNCITSNFDAGKWMKEISTVFKTDYSAPKGQNILEICNMKAKKIKISLFEEQLEIALNKANEFAKQNGK